MCLRAPCAIFFYVCNQGIGTGIAGLAAGTAPASAVAAAGLAAPMAAVARRFAVP